MMSQPLDDDLMNDDITVKLVINLLVMTTGGILQFQPIYIPPQAPVQAKDVHLGVTFQ